MITQSVLFSTEKKTCYYHLVSSRRLSKRFQEDVIDIRIISVFLCAWIVLYNPRSFYYNLDKETTTRHKILATYINPFQFYGYKCCLVNHKPSLYLNLQGCILRERYIDLPEHWSAISFPFRQTIIASKDHTCKWRHGGTENTVPFHVELLYHFFVA